MAIFVRTQEIDHEVGLRGRVSLRVTSPDVELRAVEGSVARVRVEFQIHASSEADADEIVRRARFRVHRGDDFLEVTEAKLADNGLATIARVLGIGGGKVDAEVVAEIPARAELAFDGVSADVTAIGFTGPQQYRTVSGDLVLDRVAGSIRIRGVSSDVSLRADGAVELEANTVSGDVSAMTPRFDDLRVVTVSGDVELEGDLAPAGQHRIETVSGDLDVGLPGAVTLEVRGLSSDVEVALPHRSEGTRDRRRYVVGSGGATLLFSSMSGDASVHRARRIPAPSAPEPPQPPEPPSPPAPRMDEDEELEILRALERGEIDVDEASRRLARGGAR